MPGGIVMSMGSDRGRFVPSDHHQLVRLCRQHGGIQYLDLEIRSINAASHDRFPDLSASA